MNNGIFGEGFPYSNFHDLNMDWIIKIAKDFLDQYTNIQETINTGLDEINELYTNLSDLLQQWYDTHSEDIANQLADALNDLNEWYTLHENYLDQTLTDKITEFNNAADAKAATTIASIPEDYTTLSDFVDDINSALNYTGMYYRGFPAKGQIAFTKDDVSVGDVIAYSLKSESGMLGFIDFQQEDGTRIEVVGKTSAASTQLEYSGFVTITEDFGKAVMEYSVGSYFEIYYLYNTNGMINTGAKALDTIYKYGANSIDAIKNVVSDNNVSLNFSDQSGYYDRGGTLTTYTGVSGANVSVNAGDSYVINFWSFYDMAPILFYDSNDDFLSAIFTGRTPAYHRLICFTVPANATKMLIQTLKYCTSQIILKTVTKTNNSNIDARNVTYKNISAKNILDTNTKNLFEEMNVTLSEQDGFYNYSNGGFAIYPPAGSTNPKIYGAKIDVMPGDRYLISGYSYYNMGMAVLYSGRGTFLNGWSGDDDHHYFKDIEVQIPDDDTTPAYIIVQSWKPDLPYFKIQKLTGVTSKTSILYGKKVTVIGDSITESNNLATSKNWNQYMEDWTKCIVQNLGIGGSGFTHPTNPYINRISSIQENPDIIGIACSFNDLDSRHLPIGTVNDTGTSTIAGYVNDFFDALMTAYPTTPIICYSQGPWASAKPGDQRPDDYISIVKQICRLKGIPFNDDLYNGCVLHPWISDNQDVYYKHDNPLFPDDYGNLDSVHPNSEGHKVIARYLYPMFEKNIVDTGLSY